MTIRLSSRKLKLGWRLTRSNPLYPVRIAARIANRTYHRRGYRSAFNEAGEDFLGDDWDNLLLLDACRYEMLEDHPFDGTLRKRVSRGSDTFEFLAANCRDTRLDDTVYVSGSPILDWHRDAIDHDFHDVVFVWDEEGWDEENRTVMPGDVAKWALKANETYPDKRLFVHFLQPHYPFIDTGTEWDKKQMHDTDDVHPSFWRNVEAGVLDVPKERIWELYEQNLAKALPHAVDLVDGLDGKSVVTSDHANMVGERSFPIPITEWGHPPGTYTDELVGVPWIECAYDDRREVTRGGAVAEWETSTADADVRERLADLGYVR
jgi:hypothetical protein